MGEETFKVTVVLNGESVFMGETTPMANEPMVCITIPGGSLHGFHKDFGILIEKVDLETQDTEIRGKDFAPPDSP